MERYENLSGNSGVEAFELSDDALIVRFRSGATYLYDYSATGRAVVEQIKRLATEGQGLSTYISRVVNGESAHKFTRLS